MLRRSLKILLASIGICGFCILIISVFWEKTPRSQVMQELTDRIGLNEMIKDIKNQINVHKSYIVQVEKMRSDIKSFGKNLELAKGFEQIGDQYLKSEFLSLALSYYTMGLEAFPQDSFLNYKKGLILANYGVFYPDKKTDYYKEAEKLYKSSIQFDQRYADPHYSLALLYLVCSDQKIKIGSLSEALNEIDLYLKMTTRLKNIDSYLLKARIAYDLGDIMTAIQSYQSVIDSSSVGSKPYLNAKANVNRLLGFVK